MIKKSVDIFCKCGNWLHCGINVSNTHARKIATAAGWRASASHGDLCSFCAVLAAPDRTKARATAITRLNLPPPAR